MYLEQIYIRYNGKHTPVNADDIYYCEASGCNTIFHLINDEPLRFPKTLKHVESLLDPGVFIRIHRAYLVNKHHIKEILDYKTPVVVLKNGKELVSSHRKKSNLRKILFVSVKSKEKFPE